MGKITIKKWKKFSMYRIGELQCLCQAFNSDNGSVLVLSEGHWKTGKWVPLKIDAAKPLELKEFIQMLLARFKDQDPHFMLAPQ